MPAKEEIIEDAVTLYHLVVHFPGDVGDEIDSGRLPLAHEEEAEEDQVHLPKRKKLEGVPRSSLSEAKRPRQAPESEIPGAVHQSREIGGLSDVGLRGGLRYAAAAETGVHSGLAQMESDDAVDGSHSTLPPEASSDKDHKEIINKIAGKLRDLGDDFDKTVRGRGDSSNSSISVSLASEAVEKLVSDLTYDNFKATVIRASGEDPGLQQLVCVFRLASAVANKVRDSSAAQNVGSFYTQYFTSNLADWVDSVGGWGGVLEML